MSRPCCHFFVGRLFPWRCDYLRTTSVADVADQMAWTAALFVLIYLTAWLSLELGQDCAPLSAALPAPATSQVISMDDVLDNLHRKSLLQTIPRQKQLTLLRRQQREATSWRAPTIRPGAQTPNRISLLLICRTCSMKKEQQSKRACQTKSAACANGTADPNSFLSVHGIRHGNPSRKKQAVAAAAKPDFSS